MKLIHKHKRSKQGGMALLYTVFAVFAAATMVSMMMTLTFSASRSSKTVKYGNQARYLAEGAIEAAKKNVAISIANWAVPAANGTVTVGGVQVPYTATATGYNQVATDAAGIQQIVTGYQIAATAQVNGFRHTAQRLVNAEATPIFQFAVFYTNDLEINPGASMTLGGRVHTNADMFLNCGSTLTVNSNYLRSVGNMFRTRKDDPSLSQGTVKVRQWVQNPFNGAEPTSYVNMNSVSQMASAGVPGGGAFDSTFTSGWDTNGNGDYYEAGDWLPWAAGALDYWSQPSGYTGGAGNTVMDQSHGITEAVVPQIGSIQMYEPVAGGAYYVDGSGDYVAAAPGMGTHDKGYFHSEAGLSIVDDGSGALLAYDATGTPVALPASVAKKSTFFDARQGGSVPVIVLDVAELTSKGFYPANGLIYSAHTGAGTGTAAGGIKLINGSTLPGKLTVVSENSVYVQGDYNTVAKKGASVIGDAVNLLSKSWNDSKSGTTLPTASSTTYNVAMITGNQETVAGSQYSGGLENLPRFHENWSGKNATISGSFVNTWTSNYATGNWVYGSNRYTAPNRIWNYDTAFNTVANLPPYTPMAVTARDVVSW